MIDGHHILFNRQEWELRPEAKALRTSKPLVPLMDREAHNELHRNCPAVPVLGQYALFRTLRAYEPANGDTMQSTENLLEALTEAARHPKAHSIEKSMAYLAIQAVDIQRPYIREGLVENKPTGRNVIL